MAEKETLITVPTVDDEGRTIIVTANLDVARFRSKDRYNIRVEVTLPYTAAGELGFPDDATAEMLEKITESFEAQLKGKTTAVMTGIYTGGGERNWVFYTFSTQTFNGFLNRSLAEFPLLPLKIYAENDPDWAEYDEMLKAVEM
ncbi:MAG: DUF695 domain-containing protein [Bacteroidales bacterium]|nr:DUF695 domain-containing protein [Bacteroidales bacterium]